MKLLSKLVMIDKNGHENGIGLLFLKYGYDID